MYKWRRRRAILKTSWRENEEKRKGGAIWRFEHHRRQIESFVGSVSKLFRRVINIGRRKKNFAEFENYANVS